MSGPMRAVCVTRDAVLRRTLRRSLHAAGSEVEFVDTIDAVDREAALVVIDRPTHDALTADARAAVAAGRALLVLGASLADDGTVDGLRADGCNHVITTSDEHDDAELVVTSGKLASGDFFGLEKYLAWGVRVHAREVGNYEEKRAALGAVTQSARDAGGRRSTVARIESVVDELLMNAMYDAPAAARGDAPRLPTDVLERVAAPALLRWASDGRHFAVSVEDRFGAPGQGRDRRAPAARPGRARSAAHARGVRRRRPGAVFHRVVGHSVHRQRRSRSPHRGDRPVRSPAGRSRRRRLRALAPRLRAVKRRARRARRAHAAGRRRPPTSAPTANPRPR
jgi:hypothetical protein